MWLPLIRLVQTLISRTYRSLSRSLMMELSETDIYCRQCGTTLIHNIDIPPPPSLPHLHRTLHAPNELEVASIRNYILNVDFLIDTLEADLERLNDIIDQVKSKREEMEKSRAYQATMLSPIRQLPKEVVTEIFWLICSSDGNIHSTPKIMAPFILSAICHSWRELVVGTPKLWSQIFLNDGVSQSETLFGEMIQRSGNVPLLVDIEVGYHYRLRGSPLSRVLQLLTAESCRWRSASINLSQPEMLEYIQPIKGRLPLLESLYIVSHIPSEPLQPIDFFDNSPNLTRIRFMLNIRIDILVNTFHRLTHLDINGIIANGTGVQICLGTLNSSPNLVELRLGYASWWQKEPVLARPLPTIRLEHLHRLEIKGDQYPHARPNDILAVPEVIFDHLEAPNLRHVFLDCHPGDSWLAQPSFSSFLHRSSRSLESLRYRMGKGWSPSIPDIFGCLYAVPRLKILKLDDPYDAITHRAIVLLTVEPHQPPLLPMLEELEFDNMKGEPHMYADMVGSRCGLSDTSSCHNLARVRFRLRESSADESDWMDCFEGYRHQGHRVFVTFDGRAEP